MLDDAAKLVLDQGATLGHPQSVLPGAKDQMLADSVGLSTDGSRRGRFMVAADAHKTENMGKAWLHVGSHGRIQRASRSRNDRLAQAAQAATVEVRAGPPLHWASRVAHNPTPRPARETLPTTTEGSPPCP